MTAAVTALEEIVDGAVNLRDLGGHPVQGGVVRTGLLFRAGMTHHLTANGLRSLSGELGIRTVVDLRAEREIVEDGIAPFEAVGIRRLHLAMGGESATTTVTPEERAERLAALSRGEISWAEAYEQFKVTGGEALRQLFETLAEEPALPMLFHCTAGRDRTGVAAALILSVLGVSDDAIAGDYDLTGARLIPHLDRLNRTRLEMGMTPEVFRSFLATTEEPIRTFLERLRGSHGSAAGYLLAIGVSNDTIDRVRQRLIASGNE